MKPSSTATDHVIPEQTSIPWSIAFMVSLAGIRRRMLRSLIAMSGVILAIAFLVYMLVTGDVTAALVAANLDAVNLLLQRNGVDIQTVGRRDVMLLLLIGLSLFTCLVGIVNAMMMAVTERIKEIGTLKCLGALDGFIVRSYFIESSLQGVFGTLIGMLIGILVALVVAAANYGIHVFTHFPFGPVFVSLGKSFLIGTLLSVVASIAPAYWAAKKEPVDAMRVEE